MTSHSNIGVVIVAAGRGLRAGGDLPKQYRTVGDAPVLRHTLNAFHRALPGAQIVSVIHPDDRALYEAASTGLTDLLEPVSGGATRQESVRAGLEALSTRPGLEIVLIHDGARMFVSPALIHKSIAEAERYGAAVPGAIISDSVKQVSVEGFALGTVPRETLRAVQTPQAFRFGLILSSHREAAAEGVEGLTDDAAVSEWAGHLVHIFEGDAANMKITESADFAKAETRLLAQLGDVRMGQGYDVHAFGPGDHIWLGGAKIPHTHGLVGHSDADVLSHAITDAIFGALADGDIGSHFPPSDPQWKGAASSIFLKYAVDRVIQRGGKIAHIDATIVCERPKVGPHRDAIRAALAQIIGIPVSRVAVKATTSERLGFTGREEGIAALASATIRLPFEE